MFFHLPVGEFTLSVAKVKIASSSQKSLFTSRMISDFSLTPQTERENRETATRLACSSVINETDV